MSYLSEQNTDSPIDRWQFEETSGTTIGDDVTSTHNGTISGTVTLNQPSQFIGAKLGAQFDGTSGYVNVSNDSVLGIGTIEAVVSFASIPNANLQASVLFTNAFTGGQVLPLTLGINLDNTALGLLQVGYFTGSVWQTLTWSTAPSLNTPYHLVGTYDGTSLKLYINGSLVANNTPGTARPGSGTVNPAAYIGRRWDLAQYFDGTIWDIAIYSGALSSGRVTAHYNALSNPFADNFANAGDIGVRGVVTSVDTTSWTTEASEPGSMSHTGWATFTPAVTATYRLSTVGSNFDTLLAVYIGTALTNLVLVASDDNSGGAGTSFIELSLTASTTYYIQVGAQPAGVGGNLSFSFSPAATATLTSAYIDATAVPSQVARQITATYLEASAIPNPIVRSVTATYLEAAAIPPTETCQITAGYLEVLTPSIYQPPFVGWGVRM